MIIIAIVVAIALIVITLIVMSPNYNADLFNITIFSSKVRPNTQSVTGIKKSAYM